MYENSKRLLRKRELTEIKPGYRSGESEKINDTNSERSVHEGTRHKRQHGSDLKSQEGKA